MITEMMTLDELKEKHPDVLSAIIVTRAGFRVQLGTHADVNDMLAGTLMAVVEAYVATGDEALRADAADLFESWAEFLRSGRPLVHEVAGLG